jgi:hypothetical protein
MFSQARLPRLAALVDCYWRPALRSCMTYKTLLVGMNEAKPTPTGLPLQARPTPTSEAHERGQPKRGQPSSQARPISSCKVRRCTVDQHPRPTPQALRICVHSIMYLKLDYLPLESLQKPPTFRRHGYGGRLAYYSRRGNNATSEYGVMNRFARMTQRL